jgi:hypothetical protein
MILVVVQIVRFAADIRSDFVDALNIGCHDSVGYAEGEG